MVLPLRDPDLPRPFARRVENSIHVHGKSYQPPFACIRVLISRPPVAAGPGGLIPDMQRRPCPQRKNPAFCRKTFSAACGQGKSCRRTPSHGLSKSRGGKIRPRGERALGGSPNSSWPGGLLGEGAPSPPAVLRLVRGDRENLLEIVHHPAADRAPCAHIAAATELETRSPRDYGARRGGRRPHGSLYSAVAR